MLLNFRSVLLFALFAVSSCQSVSSATPSLETEASFRLLSYNVRIDFDGASWRQRKDLIETQLTSESYDLILLQEASEFMIADYQRMLPDYQYRVGERSDGHRGDQRWYEYLPIFFRPDRFELLDHGSFWVGEDPNKPGDTLNKSKWHGRVFTWVLLVDLRTNSRFAVGNVHTHGQRAERAVELIVTRMRSELGTTPIILAGDFNMTPDNQGYQWLVGEGGFADSFSVAQARTGPEVTVIGTDESVPSGAVNVKTGGNARRIDYIFVEPAFNVAGLQVHKDAISDGLFPSDHFPLSAELELNETEMSRVARLRSDFLDPSGDVTIVAHRGCWQHAPENSLSAVQACIRAEIPVIELDVRRLATGELVLAHDETFRRMADDSRAVSSLSLRDFQGLRLRIRDGGNANLTTHEAPPMLEEALRLSKGKVLINLDFKEPGLDQDAAKLVHSLGVQEQIIFKGVQAPFELYAVEESADPEAIFMPIVRFKSMEDVTEIGASSPPAIEVLFEQFPLLNEIDLAMASKTPLWVNTLSPTHSAGIIDEDALDDPDGTWGRLIAEGADIIQTDLPLKLQSYLEDTIRAKEQ